MMRWLCCGLMLLMPLAGAVAQEEKTEPKEGPPVQADPVADSRVHLVRDPGGHSATPRELLFTPDGKKLISVADDRTIQIWDVATKERLRVIRPPLGGDGRGYPPTRLVVDRQGQRIAFCVEVKIKDDKNSAALERICWTHAKGYFEKTTGANWVENNDGLELHFAEVRRTDDLVEIHDKSRAYTIILYKDRATIKRGKGETQPWQVGGWGKAVHRGTFVCSLETGQGQSLRGSGVLAFSPDGNSLVIGEGPNLRQVDIAKASTLRTAKVKNKIQSLAFSPDGKTLAVAAADRHAYLFDAATLKPRNTWLTPDVGNVWGISWADDQTLVCRTGLAAKTLVVLNAATGELTHSYPLEVLSAGLPKGNNPKLVKLHAVAGTTQAFVAITRNAPGGRGITGNFLFDWATGKAGALYLQRSAYANHAAALAPDRTVGAEGDGGELNDIILFDLRTGQPLKDGKEGKDICRLRPAVRGADGQYTSIRWRPDGKGIFWAKLADGADRGHAEFDLEQLTLKTLKDPRKYNRELLAATLGEMPGQTPEPDGVLPVGADGKPLNVDFETGTLKDWVAEGDAFAKQPIKGEVAGVPLASRRQGQYWIHTGIANDGPQGTLTSVPFKITHPWGSFLIGGGAGPETRVELVLKEKNEVFYRASGLQEGMLRRVVVDLQPHKDKEMYIRLVDKSSEGWGFIEFDDFRFHAQKPNYPPRPTLAGTTSWSRHLRGLLSQWGPLGLSRVPSGIEIVGGPQPVQWKAGPIYWDLSFAAGGRVVYEHWGSPVLQVWDSATGKRLHATHVVHSHIQSLAVSPKPDCRYVLIGSADQTLTIYNPATGKVLLTVFPAGLEWIAWTPEGYYAGTPGGERLMGWHVDNGPNQLASFYPADRFRKRFYRPDVIKLLLKTGDVAEALKAADKALGVKETRDVKLDESLPPRAVLTVLDQSKLPLVKLQVKADASAKGQPITSLRLMMDGRIVPGQKTLVEYKAGRQTVANVEWDFELPEGEHQLAVLARSADSSDVSVSVRLKHVDLKKLPALHVLTVGINNYKDKALDLKYAAPDAEALAAAFAKNCKGPFRDVTTKTLLNQEATAKNIADALTELRQTVAQQDLVVVFFACHGVKDQKEYYLLPHDAKVANLRQTCLSGDELRKALAGYKCQVLLMLDACHAAGFGAGKKLAKLGLKAATDDVARDLTDDDCGVAVMCAAMSHEKAEGKGGHGLFTQAMLEALAKKPGVPVPFNRHNQRVYIHHLQAFVFDEVSAHSEERQHPFLSLPWVVESFVVR